MRDGRGVVVIGPIEVHCNISHVMRIGGSSRDAGGGSNGEVAEINRTRRLVCATQRVITFGKGDIGQFRPGAEADGLDFLHKDLGGSEIFASSLEHGKPRREGEAEPATDDSEHEHRHGDIRHSESRLAPVTPSVYSLQIHTDSNFLVHAAYRAAPASFSEEFPIPRLMLTLSILFTETITARREIPYGGSVSLRIKTLTGSATFYNLMCIKKLILSG